MPFAGFSLSRKLNRWVLHWTRSKRFSTCASKAVRLVGCVADVGKKHFRSWTHHRDVTGVSAVAGGGRAEMKKKRQGNANVQASFAT